MKFKKTYDQAVQDDGYHADYPNEPIGKGNPYYRCSYCKISSPEINGKIGNHATWCQYRLEKEKV